MMGDAGDQGACLLPQGGHRRKSEPRLATALRDLIGSLYEVVVAPGLWEGWLGRLCDVLSAQAGVLIVGFEPGVGDRGIVTAGLPNLFVAGESHAPYLGYLADAPQLFSPAVALGPGELLILSELLREDEFVATRFYREWMAPRGLHHVLSMVLSRTPRITGLSLLRRREAARFSSAEQDLLRRLLPHLQRVVELQGSWIEAKRGHEVAEQVLDSLGCAALRVDARCRVRHANRRGAALLERGEGLRLEHGCLDARDRGESAELRRLVRRACDGAHGGGVLTVSDSSHRHALVVSVSPLGPSRGSDPWTPAEALVLVSDPEELPALPEPALCDLYGLTSAEARVASRLARGETLDEIADALGVSRATVRSQLHQVFAKTGTHRQTDLVRVLLLGIGKLGAPGCAPALARTTST
jgi:DNA-binding CsgD family transcriptional regulator